MRPAARDTPRAPGQAGQLLLQQGHEPPGVDPEKFPSAAQDDVWGRLQETRRVQRAKLDDFYDNRRMSQMVRGMIREGKVEEARGLCRQQTEEKLAQLGSDEPYRRHYNLLWQQQRTQPISLGGDCDLGTGYVEPSLDAAPSPPAKATKVCCTMRFGCTHVLAKCMLKVSQNCTVSCQIHCNCPLDAVMLCRGP